MNQVLRPSNPGDELIQQPGLVAPVLIAGQMINAQVVFTLPGSDSSPCYPLSPADLELLQQLALGESGALVEPFTDDQKKLLAELGRRSLLQSTCAPVAALRGTPPAAATFDISTYEEEQLALVRTFVLRLDSAGFSYLGHDGVPLASMTAQELPLLLRFRVPRTIKEAFDKGKIGQNEEAEGYSIFASVMQRALASGLLQKAKKVTIISDRVKQQTIEAINYNKQRRACVASALQEAAELERERNRRTGVVRTKVIPVHTEPQPLLSLGLVVSYAMAFDNGSLKNHYEFVRDWANISVPALTGEEAPAIFLFSNYIWSHTKNMALSQLAKEKNPLGFCIHGGPDTPKYDGDIQRYLELNPHIDVLVHGEGEATLAEILDTLKEQMSTGLSDLAVLRDVPGITYRIGNEVTTTEARDRISDLNVIPSPYRNGLYDVIGNSPIVMQTIETNRGCPFGCTFCDWGSATLTKIRKFDLERVFADLEWCAKNKVKIVFNTDANFGVFERDVEIAQKVVELKEKYGYPRVFESSYAKNQVKHLKKIIEILAGGGVVSTGTLSLQSVSPDTLEAIKRSNIKVSKYDELATEFNKAKLPLIVEMMMGLPGSTVESFKGDLQQAIDREVQARVNPTEVLVNSPMNDPSYRSEYDLHLERPIEDDWKSENGEFPPGKALIVSTSTFTTSDYDRMERWRQIFLLMENYGILRHVARFIRHETGVKEMDFYDRLDRDVMASSHRWPTIAFTLDCMKDLMVPPGSWQTFIDEVRDYLVDELKIPDDSALETVLTVQHALLPARDRSFPCQVQLPHDFEQWHSSMVQSKQVGWEQDWTPAVESLRTYGPAVFTVEDSQQLASLGMGTPMVVDADFDWEFDSPVGRALRYRRSSALS